MRSWYLFLSLHERCSYGFRRCSSEVTDFHFEYNLAGPFKAIWLPVESDFGPRNPRKMRGHMTHWASSFQLLQLEEHAFIRGSHYPYRACVLVWGLCGLAARGALLRNQLPGFLTSTPRSGPTGKGHTLPSKGVYKCRGPARGLWQLGPHWLRPRWGESRRALTTGWDSAAPLGIRHYCYYY